MDARNRRASFWFCIVLSLLAMVDKAATSAETLPSLAGTELTDLTGQRYTLGEPAKAKVAVLVFLGTECPVSNGYAPTLTRLHAAQDHRKVLLLGVHCDSDVTSEIAVAHAKEYGLPFELVLDHDQRLARSCGVTTVPTAVVIGANGQLLYRGRIDNRYVSSGVRRPEATVFDLKDALTSALAGQQPNPATTEPFGCPLPPPRR